ncbi:tyrosine-type recombinase/integrase [Curtobacterium sp. VKM Ac-2884]|uniref:tyrosine-type recombinase/integrase n=1 Tax=Curtobacterium sp. VKM Ac-2884 TaxID=2783818 RepID=UPI00188D3B3D|nr:site-specific integrase [Curtobacterium sp. VKM Ac-2884]MBF4603712.1 site-specific integrase [Curtobacterium sp. VKM Ac-2884]
MAWTEKLPSGRWRGAYRLTDGSKRSAGTFDHKKAAMNAAAAAEVNAAALGWRDPRAGARTWGDWVTEWWPTRNVEPSTLLRDDSRRKTHLDDRWGPIPLVDITRHDVKAWAAELVAGGMAAATRDRCVALLSASLVAAVDAEVLTANPAARLRLASADNTRERYLTKDEAFRLLDEIPEGVPRAMAAMLFGTGLRWGEAAGATVQRLDRPGAQFRVAETWDDKLKQPKDYPKGRRRRTVPVPDWTLEYLKPLVTGRRTGFVFLSADGTPLDHHNYRRRIWMPAVTRAGLDDVHLHDARHTYASWLIQQGVPLEEVGRLLGHVSPLTTRRYAHLAETPSVAVLGALSRPEPRGADVGQTDAPTDSNVLQFRPRRTG